MLRKSASLLVFIMISASLMLAGCSSKEDQSPDPFFEKWRTMAETSQGYSQPERLEPAKPETIQGAPDYRELPQRALPTKPVTLKLNNVDVALALRSLAAVANVSVIVNAGVAGKVSLNVENSPWDNVFMGMLASNALDFLWQGDILQILTLADKELELKRVVLQSQQAQQIGLLRQNSSMKTSILPVRFADAKDLKKNADAILSKDAQSKPIGSVEVDDYTNSLLVQAIDDDLRRITHMVTLLDKSRSQIVLKAHIVEATKETARELGVQWGGQFNVAFTGKNAVGDQIIGGIGSGSDNPLVNFPVTDPNGPLGSLGFSVSGFGNNLDFQLSALQRKGKVNIVSSPSISTLDNQMAYTENGEKVPYVSTDKDGNTEVKFEDAVLRLEITPHIIDGVSMRMKVLVKKDEVDPSRAVQGNPYIIKKQTETTLIVQHGETVVISGLTKERNTSTRQGIPGLADVPGLGRLFSNDLRGQTLEEVLIFITPTILPVRDDPVLGQKATEKARHMADERKVEQEKNLEKTGRPAVNIY